MKITYFAMHARIHPLEYPLDKFNYFFISAIAFYSSFFSYTYVKCKYNSRGVA